MATRDQPHKRRRSSALSLARLGLPAPSADASTAQTASRHQPALRRTGFSSSTIRIFVDDEGVGRTCGDCGGCSQCQRGEDLRPSDRGLYHPTRAAERQLAKVRVNEVTPPSGLFCTCTDGCSPDTCPCAADGIGCYHDDYVGSCGCAGVCRSPLPCYIFDERAIKKARQAALRRVRATGP
mmetsp:Transcript_39136/g.130782  ORF Transcript_39136/g.130782 Transcript_39136/m.130782 type:complete len:181 (+) Transcript_39136:18-560(+)